MTKTPIESLEDRSRIVYFMHKLNEDLWEPMSNEKRREIIREALEAVFNDGFYRGKLVRNAEINRGEK